jgi:multisubunit Na+/H+ antiporter MnhB subunit
MIALHQTLPIWLLGVFLAIGAIYLGFRTRQRKKGSPKRRSDIVVASGVGVLVVIAVVVLVTGH